MIDYIKLGERCENCGYEVFWNGPTPAGEVGKLEELLSVRLPKSFKQFLLQCGGGGIVGAEISGVEDGEASNSNGGTVLGDTQLCRERFQLPKELVVIYFHDDEVCWCLDTSKHNNDACPVVSFNVFTRKIDRQLATDFDQFMLEHMNLYGTVKG